MWVYLNDRFVPEDEAHVSIFDRGFLYGDGLFETLRVYSGKIFRLHEHIDRLTTGAIRMAISLPARATMERLLYETLDKNNLCDALLRLTVSRGCGEVGLDPTRCGPPTVVITPRPIHLYAEQYCSGVSAIILPQSRSHPTLKSLSFLDNVIAKYEAVKKGAFEGLFVNTRGYLTEGTISNLFWVQGGRLYTPSPAAGILEGITRQVVLDLTKMEGMTTYEGLYRPSLLMTADEAFLTSTGLELMPLTQVNGKKIGAGVPGTINQRLRRLFQERVQQEITGF